MSNMLHKKAWSMFDITLQIDGGFYITNVM